MSNRHIYRLAAALICISALLRAEEHAQRVLRWQGHWKGEGLREQLAREVLSDFQFINQDIHVTFAFAADVLETKSIPSQAEFLVEMIKSGTITWDVIWLDAYIYQEVGHLLDDPDWGLKHLVDFAEIPGFLETQKPFLTAGPEPFKDTGGILVGPYIEGFVYALWYNTAVADRLGIRVLEENMSVEDLLEYGRRLKEYNRTAAEPVSLFADFKYSGSFSRLAYNFYLSSEKASHADKLRQIIGTYSILSELDPFLYSTTNSTWQDAAKLLDSDQALFLVEPTWRYNMLQKSFPQLLKKLRLAQMPGYSRQTFYVGGYMPVWAVLKNSKNRDAAVELMQFWSRPEIAEKWVRYTKSPTGLAGNLYDPEFGHDLFAEYQRKLSAGRILLPDLFTLNHEDFPLSQIVSNLYPVLSGSETADDVWSLILQKTEQ